MYMVPHQSLEALRKVFHTQWRLKTARGWTLLVLRLCLKSVPSQHQRNRVLAAANSIIEPSRSELSSTGSSSRGSSRSVRTSGNSGSTSRNMRSRTSGGMASSSVGYSSRNAGHSGSWANHRKWLTGWLGVCTAFWYRVSYWVGWLFASDWFLASLCQVYLYLVWFYIASFGNWERYLTLQARLILTSYEVCTLLTPRVLYAISRQTILWTWIITAFSSG